VDRLSPRPGLGRWVAPTQRRPTWHGGRRRGPACTTMGQCPSPPRSAHTETERTRSGLGPWCSHRGLSAPSPI
jgi:hypothetical protein